ncbi:unnamed protein product [Cylicocyclus nassatus]|uniref:Uncharacterized protein n=1 Tax=Cylicocyclus nassatus TaxID=53992 RepID=A0AA36H6L6_CYLNA|nr:unnamed protein product [Cylicocyclus nassatus]
MLTAAHCVCYDRSWNFIERRRQFRSCKLFSNSMQRISEGGYSIVKILFICTAIATAAIAGGFCAYYYFFYRKKKKLHRNKPTENVKPIKESREKLSKEIDSRERKPSKELSKSPPFTPEIPVQPRSLIINMAEHRYGGRLVLKDMKGKVRHALESDRSERLDKLEFDEDMNEIVDIGTDVDIIQAGTPKESREYRRQRRKDKQQSDLARTPTNSVGSLEPSKTPPLEKNISSKSKTFSLKKNPSSQSKSPPVEPNPVLQRPTSRKPKKKHKHHKGRRKEHNFKRSTNVAHG